MSYFDHNATTPLAPIAREAWLKAADEHWQNPSSPYRDAAKAKIRLDGARERLAELLNTDPKQIVFDSGATEGAHQILRYLAKTLPADQRILVNRTEHPCVLAAAEENFPQRIQWLDTDANGVVRLDAIRATLSTVGAIVVMAANNETGVLQPWQDIAKLAQQARVTFVCDASQWMGKLPADGFGAVDWVIAAGHKFGAPKGVGFLKIPADAKGFSAQPGGEQENGHRGGTENLPSIWSMVSALADAEQKKMFQESERLRWREGFEQQILREIPEARIVGQNAERLWNTVSVIFPAGENHRWVTKLDKLGCQVSTGSACATGKGGPSHVLAAMGFAPEEARRVVRISSGWETTEAEWQQLAEAIARVYPTLKTAPENVVKI
ncbi:MAG TPA: cysteine desulfurase family protein [Opitutaceae bacterium]|nr:cysteine desulfurase family protein [Opitutaceae bacterium]